MHCRNRELLLGCRPVKEHLLRSCVCLFVPREGRQSTGSLVTRQTIGKTLHLVAAVGYLLMRGQHIQITLGRNRKPIKVEDRVEE